MTTVRAIRERTGEAPIPMLTAYDATMARLVEAAGVEMILVGDSLGRVMLGHESTLPVTVDEMASHAAAVARGTREAVVVADMPFLSIGVDRSRAVEHCGRMIKEAGANAVKLESGPHTVELTERLTDLGIPVMAHLGLTPQHLNRTGRVRQATTRDEAERLLGLAHDHEDAGAFALVLEHVPAPVAAQVTAALSIPTIGIGAGPDCDGQVLVVNDVLGLTESAPPFAEAFGDVRSEMANALSGYVEAVETGTFPGDVSGEDSADLEELGPE